jgi:hypothetical protein
MNVADIVTEYGAYYQDRGQNVASLYAVARRPFVTEQAFTPVMTDDTIWQAGKTTFDRIVQPFQKQFTPIGNVVFKPVEIRMFHHKADSQEWPDDLEASWLGFLASDNLKRTEWPFIRWYLETQYFPQIQQDLELNEFAKGVYAAPTAGTAGAAGTAMNGCLTVLQAHITAGRITPITMGAIPASDVAFVDYVEDFADLIDKRYWNGPMQLNMNETLVRKYQRGELEKYGKNTTQESAGLRVRYSNLTLKDLPSHNGSNRMWCTPKANAVVLKKKTQNQKLVEIQGFERLVKFLSDWWMGCGFILPEIVFCNDQA